MEKTQHMNCIHASLETRADEREKKKRTENVCISNSNHETRRCYIIHICNIYCSFINCSIDRNRQIDIELDMCSFIYIDKYLNKFTHISIKHICRALERTNRNCLMKMCIQSMEFTTYASLNLQK